MLRSGRTALQRMHYEKKSLFNPSLTMKAQRTCPAGTDQAFSTVSDNAAPSIWLNARSLAGAPDQPASAFERAFGGDSRAPPRPNPRINGVAETYGSGSAGASWRTPGVM